MEQAEQEEESVGLQEAHAFHRGPQLPELISQRFLWESGALILPSSTLTLTENLSRRCLREVHSL